MHPAPLSFIHCADPPALDEGEIHLHWLREPAPFDHRSVAAGARNALERLLCRYAGLAEKPLIERGEHGKPFAPALPDIEFNLSHSGGDVLLAFARRQPLGVDIERSERRLSVDELAQRFFAPEESDALMSLPESQRRDAFFALWTCKEAVLKALGAGISFGLDRLAFALDAQGAIGALQRIAVEAGAVADWRVVRLDLAAGLFGALAWCGPPRRIRAFSLVQ